jgi:hypothetical protein
MPTRIHVQIEPALAPSVIEALLTVYAAQADALHHATNSHLSGTRPLEEVDHARRALWETEAALDGVGWGAAPPIGPVELSGSAQLIHDTITATVIAAADQLAECCREYTRARADLARVREAFELLSQAHEVFSRHERDHAV